MKKYYLRQVGQHKYRFALCDKGEKFIISSLAYNVPADTDEPSYSSPGKARGYVTWDYYLAELLKTNT